MINTAPHAQVFVSLTASPALPPAGWEFDIFPPAALDEQLLDLVLERQDLALELRCLVRGDRARDHRP